MMNRILFAAIAVLAFSATIFAQKQPEIQFENETVQFGKIMQGVIVDTFFTFKNVGKTPLHIGQVTGSCGCTRPTWPDKPIEPGESAKIGVRFNSAKRGGDQTKTITVESDATRAVVLLRIEGFVIPPAEKTDENAPVSTENLPENAADGPTGEFMQATEGSRPHQIEHTGTKKVGMTTIKFEEDSFDFGKVAEGEAVRHVFTFKNTGAEVFFLSNLRDNCNCLQLNYDETLLVKPGMTGSFEVVFETAGQKGEHSKKILVGGNTVEQEIPITLKGKVK